MEYILVSICHIFDDILHIYEDKMSEAKMENIFSHQNCVGALSAILYRNKDFCEKKSANKLLDSFSILEYLKRILFLFYLFTYT